jgi:transcriptional regulator with XRE-family HTH domain
VKNVIREGELMLIGTRLRQLREQKQMSQGDIEERTGLLRCYVSRVENGHTVPSLETLERFAGVLDVPLYQLFFSGEEAPPTPSLTPRRTLEEMTGDNGENGEDAQFLLKIRNLLARLAEPDRDVILSLAKRLATR